MSIVVTVKNEESNGHELTISNNLKINSEVLLETINKCKEWISYRKFGSNR